MESYKKAVENVYGEREKLLILGLTGRTGAGCSTVAAILGKEYAQLDLSFKEREESPEADRYKYKIIEKYMCAENRWVPFQVIQGSCVILSFVFESTFKGEEKVSALIRYLSEIQKYQEGITFKIDNCSKLINELEGIKYIYQKLQGYPLSELEELLEAPAGKEQCGKIKGYYKTYIEDMPKYKERIRKILLKYSCYEEEKDKLQDKQPVRFHLYTYLLQKFGNNIRSSGSPFEDVFEQDKMFLFAQRIDLFIKLIIKYNEICGKEKTRICIDAIRNANESNYLKDRYRFYYLLSISADERDRIERLQDMDIDERTNIDNVEYSVELEPQEIFYHQNIGSCFEMADIHLINENESNKKYFFITWQLVKYIALMLHPGLITPTQIERCMQLAFNAKYNSGCLSRQVGAIVTGNDYAVKSVGWNDVPKGQTSCILRDVCEYCQGSEDKCYSDYENKNDDFKKALYNINDVIKGTQVAGYRFPYCFKDVYNGYTGTKNQVHTRSLHAEENAFLQISKYGGQGIKDGFLFCTASPCELCSKKAYQLGIKTIYYIDPYPGISQKHILSCGKAENRPKMKQFYGAIGEAYIALYRPLMPMKDELELISGISHKKIAKEGLPKEYCIPKTNDLHYNKMEFTLEFFSREIIDGERICEFEIVNGTYDRLERKLTWTGNSYDGSELKNSDNYKLIDSESKLSPYQYQILFDRELTKGDSASYTMISHVKDESHIMHPYMAHMVKYPLDFLRLRLIAPKGCNFIKNVSYKRYADMEMKCEYADDDNEVIYNGEGEKRNIFWK